MIDKIRLIIVPFILLCAESEKFLPGKYNHAI